MDTGMDAGPGGAAMIGNIILNQPNGAGAQPKSTVTPRDYTIAAVDRALDLIEALARIGPSSLAEVSAEAGCTRTTGFRLLRTLQTRGFAVQEARGTWRLGARWGLLAHASSPEDTLVSAARPHLARLARAVGENVTLQARRELQCVTLAVHQVSADLPVYHEPGAPGPLHAGSGRLLLAYAASDVQTQALAGRLTRCTPNTRIDPAWIAADLPRIRARGWSLTTDEVLPGTVVLAAPVRGPGGRVVGALAIAASSLRMGAARARSLMPALLDAAGRLSLALGSASG